MEVISTIHNIRSKDEAFSILIRNNKLFNEDGIRFYIENGQVKLNGVSVDLLQFGSITKNHKKQFRVDFPSTPQPLKSEAKINAEQTMSTIKTVFELENFTATVNYEQLIYTGCLLATFSETLLQYFSVVTQEKILRICKALTDHLFGSMNFSKISSDYISYISREPCAVAFRFVIDFLEVKSNSREAQYEEEKEYGKQCPGYNDDDFNNKWRVCPDYEKRVLIWFERSVDAFVAGSSVDDLLLRELIQCVMNLITEKMYEHCDAEERRKKREENTSKHLHVVICNVCEGYYRSTANSSSRHVPLLNKKTWK